MQITYAPTFRGAQWVKCHGDSTSKGDSMAMAMYYTRQSATQAIWLEVLTVMRNCSARDLEFMACSRPTVCLHRR